MKDTDFLANLSQGKQGVGNLSGIACFSRKMKLYSLLPCIYEGSNALIPSKGKFH